MTSPEEKKYICPNCGVESDEKDHCYSKNPSAAEDWQEKEREEFNEKFGLELGSDGDWIEPDIEIKIASYWLSRIAHYRKQAVSESKTDIYLKGYKDGRRFGAKEILAELRNVDLATMTYGAFRRKVLALLEE